MVLHKIRLFFEWIGSYLGGRVAEEAYSKVNGPLYVYHINGKYILNSKMGNYSYGPLHRGFQRAFAYAGIPKMNVKNCLILGFGAGSIASILSEEYRMDVKMTGIENDPVVLHLAKKYFNINRFIHLDVILTDAADYVEKCEEEFDLIAFDIYIDNAIPEPFEGWNFIHHLHRLLVPGGILIYNKNLADKAMRENLDNTMNFFRDNFTQVSVFQNNPRSSFIIAKKREAAFFRFIPNTD
jgi:spermidine synthase